MNCGVKSSISFGFIRPCICVWLCSVRMLQPPVHSLSPFSQSDYVLHPFVLFMNVQQCALNKGWMTCAQVAAQKNERKVESGSSEVSLKSCY